MSSEIFNAVLAAPMHHRVLMENERVRVLETVIPPGDKTPIHEHPWQSVIHVISVTHFVRRDPDDAILLDTRTAEPPFEMPPILWSEPLPPHSLENVGDAELRLIAVELKS